jgi:anti-anti-sigma regulatory factor
MIICGANAKIKDLLSMTNLDKVLELASDKQEALVRLKQ